MAAYEILLLNTAIPQIQAAQSGDTYVVPRDIAFSAALTLSAGTANGVPYLSSPGKVLTTGSALTFDGAGVLTVGSDSVATVFNAPGDVLQFKVDSNGTSGGTPSIQWLNASSELMRLTSTGLGIGTNNPAYKLHVVNDTAATNTAVDVLALTQSSTGTADSGLGAGILFNSERPSGGLIIKRGAIYGVAGTDPDDDGALTFYTLSDTGPSGFTEKMRLDSSGNLGLGVTPSGWTAYKVLQINTGSYASSGNNAFVGSNWFYDGADKYIASDYATLYRQYLGAHTWYTAASGTAGNAISFTQAMTLDASGNLGIGTTSPNSPAGSTQITLHISNGTAGTSPGIHLTNGDTGTNAGDGTLIFVGDAANKGTTSLNIYNQESSPICFFTATTEKARITSGGDLLVGTQSSGGQSGFCVLRGASGIETSIEIAHNFGTASGVKYADFLYATGSIGSITQNGTTGVLYNITSDYRLKNVVGAVTGAGARIDALKPVDYTWKADGSAARGFLAHEFQAVYPNSVTGAKDAVDEEGKPVYQNMQASTSEVIADLVAEIQSLRARVAQLEQGA